MQVQSWDSLRVLEEIKAKNVFLQEAVQRSPRVNRKPALGGGS